MFPTTIDYHGGRAPIYSTDTTAKYELGQRLVIGDRIYKYCRANTGGTLSPQHGAANQNAIAIAYTTVAVNAAAGDEFVYVTKASASADDYKGGHVVLGHNAAATIQNRGIMASSATDSDGYVKLTLDGVLHTALTAGTAGIEVMKSIYSSVAKGSGVTSGASEYKAVVCVPNVYVATTTAEYFWGQTWGPCWCTPGAAGYGASSGERTVVWDGYGSVQDLWVASHNNSKCHQIAGFILDDTSAPEDCSLVMLQISP